MCVIMWVQLREIFLIYVQAKAQTMNVIDTKIVELFCTLEFIMLNEGLRLTLGLTK